MERLTVKVIDTHIMAHALVYGYAPALIRVDLRYCGDDPYVVEMICAEEGGESVWALSRDSLVQGVALGIAGQGDVVVMTNDDCTRLQLTSDSPEAGRVVATVVLPTKWVKKFLNETCKLVPLGGESSIMLPQIEEAIEEMLNADR
jgi:hypothetical protein